MTEYSINTKSTPPFLVITTPNTGSSTNPLYIVNNEEGDFEAKFFERLGNPSYDLGPEYYHDGGYNTSVQNHGFTLPSSSKFRFKQPKAAKFNELAYPVDNQRKVHGYFLCYSSKPLVHTALYIGGTVQIRLESYDDGTVYKNFRLPDGSSNLFCKNITVIQVSQNTITNTWDYTWDDESWPLSKEETRKIFIRDATEAKFEQHPITPSLYVVEISNEMVSRGSVSGDATEAFGSLFPLDGNVTTNTKWNTLSQSNTTGSIVNIDFFSDEEEVVEDLAGNNPPGRFLTIHPAAASSMSSGEKYDMTNLANGYFGKGFFFFKPGLGLKQGETADYLTASMRPSVLGKAPWKIGIWVLNQDTHRYYSDNSKVNVYTSGFKWVENLLSSSIESLHQVSYEEFGPSDVDYARNKHIIFNVHVQTLLGEHFWWDTERDSYQGGVSDKPFFRVNDTLNTDGTGSRNGTLERALEKAYPALIETVTARARSPLTLLMRWDASQERGYVPGVSCQKWARYLRDFLNSSGFIPETLYFRFKGNLLSDNSMIDISSTESPDDGYDPRKVILAPGVDPGDIWLEAKKETLLEIDVVPTSRFIFPTRLPVMWSVEALRFIRDASSSQEESDAIDRLIGSKLDYGYEVITTGQDYYDNTNSAETYYPDLMTDDEYSQCFRETGDRLISTRSEWVFPPHLSELPSGEKRDLTIALGTREPGGHRIITTNINCLEDSEQQDPFGDCAACDGGTTPDQYQVTLSGMSNCSTYCANCPTMNGTYTITKAPRFVESNCFWEGSVDFTTSQPTYTIGGGGGTVVTEAMDITLQLYKFGDSVYFDLRIYQRQSDNLGDAFAVHFWRSSTVASTVDCQLSGHSLSYVSSASLDPLGGNYYCDATSSSVTLTAI